MYFYDILIMLSSDENFIITSFWHTMVCLSNEDVVPDVCFVCMLLWGLTVNQSVHHTMFKLCHAVDAPCI